MYLHTYIYIYICVFIYIRIYIYRYILCICFSNRLGRLGSNNFWHRVILGSAIMRLLHHTGQGVSPISGVRVHGDGGHLKVESFNGKIWEMAKWNMYVSTLLFIYWINLNYIYTHVCGCIYICIEILIAICNLLHILLVCTVMQCHGKTCQLYLQNDKFEATSFQCTPWKEQSNSHLQRCMYPCIQSSTELWEKSQREIV